MRFVHPQFLWALLLVILPILIHLFNFRKHKQLYFSSLQFVKAVETSDRKRRNLLHLLILLARIFAIIFLVLAFAQPYFPANPSSDTNEKIYAIYVDNSSSMTMNGVSSNLLNEARENARKLIHQLPADAKILLHSNQFSTLEGQPASKAEVLARLDYIQVSPITRSKTDVIQWQKAQVQLEFQSARIHHYLFSDFQKFDSSLENLTADSIHYYHPIVHIPQSKINLTIDTVYFESPIHQTGVTSNLIFGVRNFSDKAVKGLELELKVGTLNRKLTIDVPANGRAEDKFSYVDFAPGLVKGSISVQDEPFQMDNTLHFAYQIKSEIKVCILSEPNSYSQIPLLYQLDKHYKVTATTINGVNRDLIAQQDFVILNGISDLTPGVLDDLKQFTTKGGSILLIPSQKAQLTSLNTLLQHVGLPQLVNHQRSTQKITSLYQQDPFFSGVFAGNAQQINLPGVNNYFAVNSSKSIALPLIQLQNGQGLFFKHKNTSTYLLATSIEDEQNVFTKDAIFPILLLRMAEQANQSPTIYTTLGKQGFISLRQNIDLNKPIYLIKDNIEFIPMRIEQNGAPYLNISDEEALKQLEPGVYAIQQENEVLDYIAINLERSESNTTYYSLKEIEDILQNKGIKHVNGLSVNQDSDRLTLPVSTDNSWWKYCIIISLLFILAEIALLLFGKSMRRNDK